MLKPAPGLQWLRLGEFLFLVYAIGFWGDPFILIFVDYQILVEAASSRQEFDLSSGQTGKTGLG